MAFRMRLNGLDHANTRELSDAIYDFITLEIGLDHENDAIVDHHFNLLAAHRGLISRLEGFLTDRGLGKFVPLPAWDAAEMIPGSPPSARLRGSFKPAVDFFRIKGIVNGQPDGNVNMWYNNPLFARPIRPQALDDAGVPGFPSAQALSEEVGTTPGVNWHTQAHAQLGVPLFHEDSAVGALIFWPFHASFCDLYHTWQIGRQKPLQKPVSCRDAKSRLCVVAIGKDESVWFVRQESATLAAYPMMWRQWERLPVSGTRAAVVTANGVTWVFAVDANGALSVVPAGDDVPPSVSPAPEQLATHIRSVYAGVDATGAAIVFAERYDTSILTRRRTGSGNAQSWAAAVDFMPPEYDDLQILTGKDGRMHLVASANDAMNRRYVWHRWETSPGKWMDLPYLRKGTSDAKQVRIIENSQDQITLFCLTTKGGIEQWTCPADPGATGGDWKPMPRPMRTPSSSRFARFDVARHPDGRLAVFALTEGGAVWRMRQEADGSWPAKWQVWAVPPEAGDAATDIRVDRHDNGTLDVFVCAADGLIWHRCERTPAGLKWEGWLPL